MNFIKIKANAKVNLFLDITGKREDGYHELDSVMMSVGVADTLTFTKTDTPRIELACADSEIPRDKTNIIYKCAEALFERYGILDKAGVLIVIEKNIPTQAGMGGGSADGAAALIALNKLFELGADEDTLCKIGAQIGADIPFCIRGGCCLCRGIGEKLSDISFDSSLPLVIVKPKVAVSTPKAYKDYDLLNDPQHEDIAKMIKALEAGSKAAIGGLLFNAFEEVIHDDHFLHPKLVMKQHGALGTLMTGSGSAVFGIFESMQKAEFAYKILKGFGLKSYLCENEKHGTDIIEMG